MHPLPSSPPLEALPLRAQTAKAPVEPAIPQGLVESCRDKRQIGLQIFLEAGVDAMRMLAASRRDNKWCCIRDFGFAV